MIDRRGFLGSLGALAVAPFVPMPVQRKRYLGMVRMARVFDAQTGISIRFIQNWDDTLKHVNHVVDAIYSG